MTRSCHHHEPFDRLKCTVRVYYRWLWDHKFCQYAHNLSIIAITLCVTMLTVMTTGCGHKSALNPPPPVRIEPVTAFRADVGCGKIMLEWNPVHTTTTGQILDQPAQYLVFRRRGEKIQSGSVNPSSTPAAEGTSSGLSATPTRQTQDTINWTDHGVDLPDPLAMASNPPLSTPGPNQAGKDQTPPADRPVSDGILPPTPIPSDLEYKLIAIIAQTLSQTTETGTIPRTRLRFEDTGLPGVDIPVNMIRFRQPKQFPPVKSAEDIDLVAGYTYFYQIKAVATDGITSDPSYAIEVPYFPIPNPPDAVQTVLSERVVVLKWKPPEFNCDGTLLDHLSGYIVERSEKDSPESFQVIATINDVSQTSYSDNTVRSDSTYFYRIYGFVNPLKVPGLITESIRVDTTDTFRPKKPANLKAAASVKGIHLLWDSNTETDIAGYRIYRAQKPGGPFTLLNSFSLIKDSAYTDSTIDSGGFYMYRVTAVDQSKNQNESEPSETVNIQFP